MRLMNRRIEFVAKQFYHLYNSGKDGQDIFISHSDYFRFTLLLYCCNSDLPVVMKNAKCVGANYYGLEEVKRGKPLVDIVSHSMMANRFHLILREKKAGNISKFMAKLITGYTMYFNQKYERQGPLLAGPFKCGHVDSDAYLKYLFAYIHLKPLKHRSPRKRSQPRYLSDDKIKDLLNRYEYSSFLDYLDPSRRRGLILNNKVFNRLFPEKDDFFQNVFDWLRLESTKNLDDKPKLFYQLKD